MKPLMHVLGHDQLAEAIRYGLNSHPSSCEFVALHEAEVIWVAYDTPIIGGQADAASVLQLISDALPRSRWLSALVIVSSQLPVGSVAQLERAHPRHRFVCVPENIRLSHNIQDWLHQPRIIIGSRQHWEHEDEITNDDVSTVAKLCRYFTTSIICMGVEDAEMVKHAMNGFLALCVAYSNEVAEVCEAVGADPLRVAEGLLTDPRVGQRAYLRPSGPYTTGHLEREVENLINLGAGPVVLGTKLSNEQQIAKQQSRHVRSST